MLELKLTKKWDGKIKGLHFEEDTLIDENGEVVNLNGQSYLVHRRPSL